ncbi:MAG: ABC transporter ATP-binding protein, partial [Desulfovibrio sp.]
LQAEYAKKEKALEAVLARHDEVEALLADPDVYADGTRVGGLLKEFHELEEKSERGLEELGALEAEIADLEKQRAALSLDGEGQGI